MFDINKKKLSKETMNKIFPKERTDIFFTSLLGDSNDGAYDIQLLYLDSSEDKLNFEFQLKRRIGKCLNCSLTYGLPEVFVKHPVINIEQLINNISKIINIDIKNWELGSTIQKNQDLHIIPLKLEMHNN